MLYLDYSRGPGEWLPNAYGGRENLDAIALMRRLNEAVYREHPDVQMIAEESTAWPMVSRPTTMGGLGFGMKWDVCWMHDTLRYLARDPIFRRHHQTDLTFRLLYAFAENFVLPLSHDEVAQGKGSLLAKMPGDDWQKSATLRLLFGYQYAQPGKKLLFMGGEFGQWREWHHDASLDWHLLKHSPHIGVQRWVKDLNALYHTTPVLHELDFEPGGFEWVDCADTEQSVVSLLRRGRSPDCLVVGVFDFTPVPRYEYRLSVPRGGYWREVLNSDAKEYGGSGLGNFDGVAADFLSQHGRPYSLSLTLPPLSALFLVSEMVIP
jgi:1,4-alpha-glucan branching enzyme